MNIRNIIRKIIMESENLQMDFGDPDKAKRAIIALSKGLIPKSDIDYFKGRLSPNEPEETGHFTQEGEVEISFTFEGTRYSYLTEVTGEFYYTYHEEDYFTSGSSEVDDETISIPDTALSFGDFEQNEFNFELSELPASFKEDMENYLLGYYDPYDGEIGF